MGKTKGKESAWLGFIDHTALQSIKIYFKWIRWFILLVLLIFNLMLLQNICCTWRSTSRLLLLAEKIKQNKENCLSDLTSLMYVYSRFKIKDCSSSRLRESTSITSITIHNGFSAHHDSWITKMFHHRVTKTNISSPTPCSNAAYGQTYFKTCFLHLYVRVSAT